MENLSGLRLEKISIEHQPCVRERPGYPRVRERSAKAVFLHPRDLHLSFQTAGALAPPSRPIPPETAPARKYTEILPVTARHRRRAFVLGFPAPQAKALHPKKE